MKPSIGRIVTAVGFKARSNGTDEAPAMITRVWGQREDGVWTVNATLFPDNKDPQLITSVLLYPSPDAARETYAANEQTTALHWPERVEG